MGTKPSDAIHVGDHFEFDYLIPKRLGMQAYFLDRDGNKPKDSYTVKDLGDFVELIKNPLPSK